MGVGLDLITFRGLVYENVFDEDKQLSRWDGRRRRIMRRPQTCISFVQATCSCGPIQ